MTMQRFSQQLTSALIAFLSVLLYCSRSDAITLFADTFDRSDNHDIDAVTTAARGLSQFGLTWDATRLASQAALQTPDGRVSGAMLQLARDLKQTIGVDDASGPESVTVVADGARSPSRPASSKLSDREREVAELLLLGMPYRDIGSQLFISAKTVEHHVARIRRRLGAESRSEMLSMLRALLTPQG